LSDNPLQTHRQERDDLLARALALLEADEQFVAAWLHGSMGHGTHDDWSDIDLWIVVDDERMATNGAQAEHFARGLGEPLLTLSPPQNAPPGGEYLLALYSGTHGPLMLDCSWQPLSMAQRPPDTRLLFDRAGIPPAEEPDLSPEDERLVMARQQIDFFWMMATVAGKAIARGRDWDALSLLRFVWTVLAGIEYLAGKRPALPDYSDPPPFPAPVGATEQLAALRGLVSTMEQLTAQDARLSADLSPQIPAQVSAYVDMVEREAQS
jgi:hypothetical protein